MHSMISEYFSQILTVLFGPVISGIILGLTIILRYFDAVPLVIYVSVVALVTAVLITLQMASNLVLSVNNESAIYPNQLRKGIKEDIMFARSSRPFLFYIGMFTMIRQGTYLNVLKDVVLANVIDLLLFIRDVEG